MKYKITLMKKLLMYRVCIYVIKIFRKECTEIIVTVAMDAEILALIDYHPQDSYARDEHSYP
jgi:hypothetical protein